MSDDKDYDIACKYINALLEEGNTKALADILKTLCAYVYTNPKAADLVIKYCEQILEVEL